MTNSDRIFKQLQYCIKHIGTPDLHSFTINIRDGIAYVEVRTYGEVFIETRTRGEEFDKVAGWCGTMIAAANRLDMFGADPDTISY
jgi:hypothetical protein